MKTVILFTCLLVALCVMLSAGCCHLQPQNRVAVPNKDFPYSFDKAPFISPRIIQDLSTWISDSGDQVVAINVLEAQGSNRYHGDAHVGEGHPPYVSTETTTVDFGVTNNAWFGYHFIGMTKSGVYVLETSDSGGGSGVFRNILLLTFEDDDGIVCDWEKTVARHLNKRKRLLINKLGEIPLGDRWDGELKVEGDSIIVGKDRGWFSVSGGTGGAR